MVFRQPVQVVQQVDEQELLADALWKRCAAAKVISASVELELAVSLVIVDDRRVVELRRSHAQAVVGVGRHQQEPVIVQEGADQFFRRCGCSAETCLSRRHVDPARNLLEPTLFKQLLEVAIDSVRPLREILAAVGLSRPEAFLEVVKR